MSSSIRRILTRPQAGPRFSVLPRTMLSMTTISRHFARPRSSTIFEPTKPAPPVTSTFLPARFPSFIILLLRVLAFLKFIAPLDHPRRHADGRGEGWNIPRHHRPGADDGPAPMVMPGSSTVPIPVSAPMHTRTGAMARSVMTKGTLAGMPVCSEPRILVLGPNPT